LWDLLQEAGVIVDPARRNDLSRKPVLITGSDCYQQWYFPGELEPCLGGSHQIMVAFLRDDVLLDDGEGMVRMINSGDKAVVSIRAWRHIAGIARPDGPS
jgi:hypothetical protein